MRLHQVQVHPSQAKLSKESQLAWQIALVANDPTPLDADVKDMIINRLIDNSAVAIAAINRTPVANARSQALAHPRKDGATLYGLPPEQRFCAEWAAWANSTAVRELDFHDTFLAADYAHPGDSIAPLLAVAQQMSASGDDLIRAIATAYEIHIDLVKGISLHKHKIDHMAHLTPAVVAGLGTLLKLEPDIIYQAVQQAVHVSFTTRQSRKGEISSWKAYVPGHAGKLAIEAVDRAMRGERSPSPIYEGEDSVIAWLLDGPEAVYTVPLPEPAESKRSILESYTKEHSAEYQAQAVIDLAFDLRGRVADQEMIEEVLIHTSHHTHVVIGSGSGDPQKYDPQASRETLDHSIMYIFSVAFQDGLWHHEESYLPERAQRPDTVRLWNKVRTVEDSEWTRRYHHPDPQKRAFGSRVEIRFIDGSAIEHELSVANAHPNGKAPFERSDYLRKFTSLTIHLVTKAEQDRFLDAATRLVELSGEELPALNVQVPDSMLLHSARDERGIF
jgi:2-methylcitrate dehydratase